MKSISTKEILQILKECSKLGVTRLRMGDLEMSFGPESLRETLPNKVREKPKAQAVEEKKSIAAQESRLRQEQIEELMIADPEEYERRIAMGELVDAETHDSGAESALQ